MAQIHAPQPACMSLSIPIWEKTVSQLQHGCPFTAHLQTPSPHATCVSVSYLSWKNLPSWGSIVVESSLQGIVPLVLADDLLATQAMSALGWPGPKVSHEQPRTPTSIINCMQDQNNSTSAILFESGQLWPDNQLRKLRFLVFSLQLGPPCSKSQNQWTGVEWCALYPAESQGRWVWIPQVDHPHPFTPTLITPGATFYQWCQGNTP